VLTGKILQSICVAYVPHDLAMETENVSPELGTPASSRNVEVFCGKYSGGHDSSTVVSENKLEVLERELVGEWRSLLCEGGMRVAMTGQGRWREDGLESVHDGEATPVVMFSLGEGWADVWVDSGIPRDPEVYSLSWSLRALSR